MNPRSKISLAYRGRALRSKFLTQYYDLIKAIKDLKYEAIEQICEEKLTQEIAASIYELTTFKNS